jgi:hypothetical protein
MAAALDACLFKQATIQTFKDFTSLRVMKPLHMKGS